MRFQVALLLMNKSVRWKDIVMPGRESYTPGERLKGKKRGRVKELHYVRKAAPPRDRKHGQEQETTKQYKP